MSYRPRRDLLFSFQWGLVATPSIDRSPLYSFANHELCSCTSHSIPSSRISFLFLPSLSSAPRSPLEGLKEPFVFLMASLSLPARTKHLLVDLRIRASNHIFIMFSLNNVEGTFRVICSLESLWPRTPSLAVVPVSDGEVAKGAAPATRVGFSPCQAQSWCDLGDRDGLTDGHFCFPPWPN